MLTNCPDLANVNCNEGVDVDDALRIVRCKRELPMAQPTDCREINT